MASVARRLRRNLAEFRYARDERVRGKKPRRRHAWDAACEDAEKAREARR